METFAPGWYQEERNRGLKERNKTMDNKEAQEIFQNIRDEYDRLEYPKYRRMDLASAVQRLKALNDLKPYLREDPLFRNLLNSLSQIISRLTIERTWRNTSERGINKVIP